MTHRRRPGSVHLGEQVSALVDGELGHEARDHALAHLTSCDECRAAVDAERRMKAQLGRLAAPPMPMGMRDRLQQLPHELTVPGAGEPLWSAASSKRRPSRPAGRADRRGPGLPRLGGTRPGRPVTRHRRRRAAAVGVTAVTAALSAAFLVGGGPASGRPVTPQVDRFAVEHAAVTPEVPLSDQGGPAVLVSFAVPRSP